MDRHLLISSDCHAGLPPGGYREYLDPQYREAFDEAMKLQIAATEEQQKHFLVKDINEKWRQGRDAELSGAWDHDERIKVLDADGVAGEVIFPDGITEMNAPPFGAGIGMTPRDADRELQWAGARAHNRWLAELVQMAPERREGVAVVPATWDIDEAVTEVRWARENGLGSIMLPVMWHDHAPYSDECYDPLWAVCQDLDVVVHYHSGPAPMTDYFGQWPPAGDKPTRRGAMGIYVSEVAWWLARPLTFLIWGGVFEMFPKLKVAATEGTSIWVPSFLELLDQRAGQHAGAQKLGDFTSHLKLKPSEYFARNIRVGAMIPEREAELRHEIGVGNVMWGTDYPHPEGSWPETAERLVKSFRGVPVAERDAMLGGNAAEWYRFDTEKLAPLVARIGPEKAIFEA
jgi:predicted TIM-barrel fold metal-dependent hydrolase